MIPIRPGSALFPGGDEDRASAIFIPHHIPDIRVTNGVKYAVIDVRIGHKGSIYLGVVPTRMTSYNFPQAISRWPPPNAMRLMYTHTNGAYAHAYHVTGDHYTVHTESACAKSSSKWVVLWICMLHAAGDWSVSLCLRSRPHTFGEPPIYSEGNIMAYNIPDLLEILLCHLHLPWPANPEETGQDSQGDSPPETPFSSRLVILIHTAFV
ncbi:hypothetical protein M1O53_01650 [Dehalococcoidia bacterium]|nr:hypothetical protein [Dehalococcoidia bacterium]